MTCSGVFSWNYGTDSWLATIGADGDSRVVTGYRLAEENDLDGLPSSVAELATVHSPALAPLLGTVSRGG